VLKELEKFQAKLREAKKKNQQDVDLDNEDNSNWYCGKGLRFAVDSSRVSDVLTQIKRRFML
jgi:NOL1/NOP2/fmu family ribosome biogenesis protein